MLFSLNKQVREVVGHKNLQGLRSLGPGEFAGRSRLLQYVGWNQRQIEDGSVSALSSFKVGAGSRISCGLSSRRFEAVLRSENSQIVGSRPRSSALTVLPTLGLLNRVHDYACAALGRDALSARHLRPFASTPCE